MPSRPAKTRNSSSPSTVYERLKRLILEQKVAPGDPLPEEDLARRFGVSRTPVHAALVRLEKDRLVTLQAWRGTFVRGMSMADVRELCQIREALEGMVARLAAETMTDAQVARLEANWAELKRLDSGRDPEGFFETAREFHWILIRSVANQRIHDILANIREQLIPVKRYLVNNADKVAADLRDHPSILAAIRERRPAEAERLMRSHIQAMRSSLLGAGFALPAQNLT